MITSVLQQLLSKVKQPENKIFDPENYGSYIGTINYIKKSLVFESDDSMYLGSDSDDFREITLMLEMNPLGRKGMTPNWQDNKLFLERELAVWTGKEELDLNNAPWMSYSNMWEGIPNVSECAYGKLMSAKFSELQDKLFRNTVSSKLCAHF